MLKIISLFSLCCMFMVGFGQTVLAVDCTSRELTPVQISKCSVENSNRESGENAEEEINSLIGTVLDILALVAGVIAVIVVIVQGLKYITSSGNAEQAKSATKGIIYTLIGVVIVISARAIILFVLDKLGSS